MKRKKWKKIVALILSISMALPVSTSFMELNTEAADSALTEYEFTADSNEDWEMFSQSGDVELQSIADGAVGVSGESGYQIVTLKTEAMGADSVVRCVSYTLTGTAEYFANIIYGYDVGKVYGLWSRDALDGLYHESISLDGSKQSLEQGEAPTGWIDLGKDFEDVMNTRTIHVDITFDQETETTKVKLYDDGGYKKTFNYHTEKQGIALYLTADTSISNLKMIAAKETETEKNTESVFSLNSLTNDPYLNLNNWSVFSGDKANASVSGEELVLTPNASDKKQVALKLNNESIAPSGEMIMKISYEFKKEQPSTSEDLWIIYDYTDESNYRYYRLYYQKGSFSIRKRYVENGQVTSDKKAYSNMDVDFSDWNTLTFDYTEAGYVKVGIESEGHTWSASEALMSETRALVIQTPIIDYSSQSTESMRFRNFNGAVISKTDEKIELKKINLFREQYQEILHLQEAQIAINYESAVDEALLKLDTFSAYAKIILQSDLNQLNYVKEKIVKLKAEGVEARPERGAKDYTDFTEDFENGMYRWVNLTDAKYPAEIIEEGETGNHVLLLRGLSKLTPNSFSFPKKAKLKSVSYRIKGLEDAANGTYQSMQIPISYVDADNHVTLSIWYREEDAERASYRFDVCSNGVSAVQGQVNATTDNALGIKCDLRTKWIEVAISYSDTGAAAIHLSDGAEEASMRFQLAIQNRPALQGAGRNDGMAKPVYIDDVVVTMEEGTWDEDIAAEDLGIRIYRTGSTSVKPDDVVLLQGEQLSETVAKGYVLRLNDKNTNVPGYIVQKDFDTTGTKSQYVTATDVKDVWTSYTEAGAVPVQLEFLQMTRNQVTFVLPDQLESGVYAILLEGYDDLSEEDDTIVYLNAPQINSILGSDGSSSAPGDVMKIQGENLALYDQSVDSGDYIPDDKQTSGFHNTLVKVALVNNKNAAQPYIFSGDEVIVKAEEYIEVNLPEDMPQGDYEVFVYNGFGDGSCWTMPDSITVEPHPYDSWPQTIFNVRDFGATGDRTQNDTASIVDALTAASENGGGVVYFPKGIYTLIHSIIIPERVQIVGEGVDDSIIIWNPEQWKWNSAPTFLCGFTGNVRFSGLGIYATRCNDIFRNYHHASGYDTTTYEENVYFEDIYMYWNPYVGRITGGDSSQGGTGMSASEMKILSYAETKDKRLLRLDRIENLRIQNVDFFKNSWGSEECLTFGTVNHAYMGNWSMNVGYLSSNLDNTIVEYFSHEKSCWGVKGNNLLHYACEFVDVPDNNRELTMFDGNSRLKDIRMRKDLSDPTGRTYIFMNAEYGKDSYIGQVANVYSGQGMGQSREIVANDGAKVVFASPFDVEPNSNSLISFSGDHGRRNIFYVKCFYSNGAAAGAYSTVMNVVWDACAYEHVSHIYLKTRLAEYIWYASYVNGIYYDPFVLHTIGSEPANSSQYEYTGFSFLRLQSYGNMDGILNVIYRNNQFDGYRFECISSASHAFVGVIFDKNTFSEVEYALDIANGTADGVFAYKNVLNDVAYGLCKTEADIATTANPQGYNVYMDYVEDAEGLGGFEIGDINGDGKINTVDATLLKYYLGGDTILTGQQLRRADFYDDNTVDIRDSTAILHYVLTGEVLEPNPGWYPGYW